MRVLALDVGDRNIGVALSDPTGILASPLTTVQRTGGKRDYQRVLDLVRDREAELIVIGMPVSLDGVPREQAVATQAFSDELSRRSPVPVVTWDERLTTVEGERRMREAGASAQQRKQGRDSAAAAVLLQAYLEHLRMSRERRDSDESA
jgi:putative Holliday junction resolvase